MSLKNPYERRPCRVFFIIQRRHGYLVLPFHVRRLACFASVFFRSASERNRSAVRARTAFAYMGSVAQLRCGGALLHTSAGFFLEQCNVNAVLGHRSRSAYALTYLAPTKRYQRLA